MLISLVLCCFLQMANREITKLTRDVSRLKFSNPGRFMEDFDPERSGREMRKVHRRFYRESSVGFFLYIALLSFKKLCILFHK